MKVRVRVFGALAEALGVDEETLNLPHEATAGGVIETMRTRAPASGPVLDRCSVAVNLETVGPDHELREGDEVAILPPVAGGGAAITVGLAHRPSVEEGLAAVSSPEAGGTVAFVGTVRAEGGAVERLEYSAYAEMAEGVLRAIAEEAADRWSLIGISIVHGVGDLAVGEATFVVACSAPHRGEAFDACRHVVDEVKRRVPVWKKEVGPDRERWVGL
jgi:MoaE-MoaD fusion protein